MPEGRVRGASLETHIPLAQYGSGERVRRAGEGSSQEATHPPERVREGRVRGLRR